MSFDLGDQVPLSVTITNTAGAPDNAGNVALTITLPDGTTHIQASVPGTAGAYGYDYETIQAGRHGVRWLATGVNACAFTDVFDVDPPDGGAFISLADARHHLNKTPADDEQLRVFLDAACQVITDRMGAVSPQTVTADRTAYRGTIVLPKRPVISVTSVVQLPGGQAVPQADALAGTTGWTLANSEGVLRTPLSCGAVRITYRIGRSPLPANFRLAALDLVKHLWQGSQHNNGGGRPALGDADAIAASVRPYALPYRVSELLGLKHHQERDEPLIG